MSSRRIKDIIKESEKNIISNNDKELERLRKELIEKKEKLEKISTNKLKNKLKKDNLSYDEYNIYKPVLDEKKSYEKNKNTINDLINKNYSNIENRLLRKKQLTNGIIIGSLFICSLGGGIKLINKQKRKEYKEPTTTVEETTQNTTELTTEEIITTENDTTENIYETTENITESTTETEEIITTTEEEKIENITTEETIITENITTTEENTTEWYEFDDYFNPEVFEKGEEIFNTISPYIDTMEEVITDPDKRQEALNYAKESAIMLIDFIFYGEEINGVTFDELKDEEKQKIYAQLQKLDSVIIQYDPDYKEKWGERYSAVKDFTTVKINDAKEAIIEKIGEEKYNEIIEKKDNFVNGAKETGGYILQFIDDKYQNWKNK